MISKSIHRAAQFACAAGLLVLASTSLSLAQVQAPDPAHRAAVPATPTILNGYYNERVSKSCSNFTACEVDFSKVPAGKTLVVRHIACYIQISKGSLIQYLQLAKVLQTANSIVWTWGDYLAPLSKNSQDTNNIHYSLSDNVTWPVPAAQNAFLYLHLSNVAASGYMDCAIDGTIS